jgi:hypothetical protein
VAKKLRLLSVVVYDWVMHTRPSYPTDLSDQEWALIYQLVPEARPGGRPEAHPKREILNAPFPLRRSGCSWRPRPGATAKRLVKRLERLGYAVTLQQNPITGAA